MSYKYYEERAKLFTEEGQRSFLKVRDKAFELLKVSGAFEAGKVIGEAGDWWVGLACLDRMVEIGDLRKLNEDRWAQFWIFTLPDNKRGF